MAAENYDFTVVQGETFNRTITYRDASGALVNLTGFSAAMQIRDGYDAAAPSVSLTEAAGITLGGALGTINVVVTAAVTAGLDVPDSSTTTPPSKEYYYDLEISVGGDVRKLLYGKFIVVREVTR